MLATVNTVTVNSSTVCDTPDMTRGDSVKMPANRKLAGKMTPLLMATTSQSAEQTGMRQWRRYDDNTSVWQALKSRII
jgi:hypothetical protein